MAKNKYGMGGVWKRGKLYSIFYSVKGRRVREKTGSSNYAVAQQLLKRRVGEVARGEFNGLEAERIRVSELWEPFLRDRKIKGRGLEHLKRRWTLHLEPFIAQYRASDVGTDLLNEYVEARQNEGTSNATINRELAVIRGMLRLAYFAKPQKVRSLPKFPRLDESQNVRTGFLDPKNYQALADNANKIGLWMRALFEIAYTWGWRKGELKMQVRQVDFDANEVRLDPGKTKTKRGRAVTMTPTIRALLTECARGKQPDDLLFTRAKGQPVNDFRSAWHRLCVLSGVGHMVCPDCDQIVAKGKCSCGGRRLRYRGLTVHDLRRTAVRNMVRAGIPEHTAMAISGHKTRSVFDRYDIVDQRDISNAMLKLEQARREIVTKSVTVEAQPEKTQNAKPN